MSDAMHRISKEGMGIAKRLANDIEKVAGVPISFSLFIWTPGRGTYISNAHNREEVIRALEEMIKHWKDGMPDVPAHTVD